ncbi:phosphodiester glycosidase family protein [Alistipes sp. D31t1_170403_E11]|uniref:phosphodiester glycosidase family protein n=1 Tax=Alistipes sp. D31t1_170403_E11 TaxID=2787128 RepID=UPI00189C273D|nr:phosphodiester glycosidase family protein [Alistipes sp. D31t1_170403_E11]
MNKTLLGALALLCSFTAAAQTPRDSIAFAAAEWRTTDLGDGAECRYAQIDMFGSCQSISVATYPGRSFTTAIVHLDRKAEATSALGKAAGAEIAVNGSYFNVKTFAPVTFVLLDKKVVGRTTPEELMRTNGIVAFKDKKGRKMDIFPCDTTQYPDVARRYRSALAAGPVLIDNGKTVEYTSGDSFYTRRHPRTLIGKRADGTVVMAVIDGRFKGQGDGATIAETAYIARQLGLTEALNLDGGGSSTLWTAKEGVLNHPYDNRRFDHEGERGVPNCIVVRK